MAMAAPLASPPCLPSSSPSTSYNCHSHGTHFFYPGPTSIHQLQQRLHGLRGSRQQRLRMGKLSRSSRKCLRSSRSLNCSSVPAEMSLLDEATILELPCLPFSPAEVFVPSSSKTLHLYEARFLALLDEVMAKGNNLLAHIVVEPVKGDDIGVASFVATYGCLARIESVKQLELGALVTIRGIGRIKMVSLTQMEPFIKSTVIPVRDDYPADKEPLSATIQRLLRTLADVQQLQIKIKTGKDESLQTPLEKALQWAEKGEAGTVAQGFVPGREERLSFAALQPIAGASPGELHKLLQERLKAMATLDTEVRLSNVSQYAEQSRASVAAKVALQSLQF